MNRKLKYGEATQDMECRVYEVRIKLSHMLARVWSNNGNHGTIFVANDKVNRI